MVEKDFSSPSDFFIDYNTKRSFVSDRRAVMGYGKAPVDQGKAMLSRIAAASGGVASSRNVNRVMTDAPWMVRTADSCDPRRTWQSTATRSGETVHI